MTEELGRLAEVYWRPLDDFTSARKELAARLQEEGLTEEADSVRRARKPTVTAWAVDQLAHRRPDDLHELVDLTDDIAEADDASKLRAARERRMSLIADLADTAMEILEMNSHAAGTGQRSRITSTLIAASVGEGVDRLLSGTLDRDVEAAGFAGSSLSLATPECSPARTRASEKAEELVRRAETAEKEAARLEQQAARAQRDAENARRRAERARAKADEALAQLAED